MLQRIPEQALVRHPGTSIVSAYLPPIEMPDLEPVAETSLGRWIT